MQGVLRESSSMSCWSKSTSASTAVASRWSTVFVEPPMAMSRRMALEKASFVAMERGRTDASSSSYQRLASSTNTVLHLLATAVEAEVDFDQHDIDELSRKTPCICKVAPNSHKYYMEDVHRAGGIPAILGELDRGGLLSRDVHAVHADSLDVWLGAWDIRSGKATPEAIELFHAAPGGVRTTEAFSSTKRWPSLDTDSENGCIRATATPYTADGGLAILRGNLAPDGCIVKTAGVPEEQWAFRGTARVSESQEAAVEAILGGKIKPGDVVLVRYEGPKGGPGMQEMLYPTSYLKAVGLGPQCALITDGRFSGGSSGLCIGHISPEAAEAGAIALVEEGDTIQIDIPKRILRVNLPDAELAKRRAAMEARGTADSNAVDAESKGESAKSKGPSAWKPANRTRKVSQALQAYAALTTSASRGAVRD